MFSVAVLRHFHEDKEIRPKGSPPSPVVDADRHERYIVDAVISQRKYRGKQQYLVKWKGYDDPTWEPEDFLLKTIRITRTLIRDNTHDLNDTRGHSFY